MTPPVLVIISGLPGSGKSTLARRIAPELGLPLFDRDDFKDALFDALGWSDRVWSQRVGVASWELMYLVAERVLGAGRSLMLESNFDRRHHPERLPSLKARVPHVLVEVCCITEPGVNWERFWSRWERGERHPGHVADQDPDVARRPEPGANEVPVGVADHVFEVDTTDFERIDYERIVAEVRRVMETTGDAPRA